MKNVKKTRRQFLYSLTSLAALPILSHCSNPLTSESINSSSKSPRTNADILLSNSETDIVNTIKNQYPLIESLSKNLGRTKSIGYYDNGNYKELGVSIINNDLADYPYLRLVKKETNESVNILFGMEGIYPSFKFVDDNGKLLVKNNQVMEFAIRKTDSWTYSSLDWFNLCVKILALGLLIWLGFSILKFVVSAIAFIVFNALLLGIVLAGLSLVVPLLKWLFDLTSWTINDVKYWFERTITEIMNLLLDIQYYILYH